MLQATRNFVRRNRTNLAVGFGLVGAGYVAVQYIGSKLSDARNRMLQDRMARENMQRRFEQNQEDCSFTVQALLPTASALVLAELPVEKLTQELQQKKAARLASSSAASTADSASEAPAPVPAAAPPREDDTQSLMSFASESFVGVPPPDAAAAVAERPRKSKSALWNEIKISSLTRSFTLLYTLALLTLLTRVQLNLLGRKNYLSSVVSLAEREAAAAAASDAEVASPAPGPITLEDGVNLDINRQYLTFSWWLLHRGWRSLLARVEAAVKDVFGPLTPRDTISQGQFNELVDRVRERVERDAAPPPEDPDAPASRPTSWLPFLLPPRQEEAAVLAECGIAAAGAEAAAAAPSDALRKLLDETSDLVDSPMAANVLRHMVDMGFAHLLDAKLAKLAFAPKTPAVSTEAEEAENRLALPDEHATAKFASVLAVVARQAHLIGNGSPNEYLEIMERHTELEAFSALVYSSNFEYVAAAAQATEERGGREAGSAKAAA